MHPPVEIDDFSAAKKDLVLREQFYIVTSRQVTWKRLDLAIKACLKLKRNLIVVGEGPEHGRLVKMAGKSDLIKFVPLVDKKELAKYLRAARGYLFPSMEPFGIAPVEALAAGCPVVAYGEGGSKDYIIDGTNGVLFEKQTMDSLAGGILKFEKIDFNTKKVMDTAKKFSVDRFNVEIRRVVDENSK